MKSQLKRILVGLVLLGFFGTAAAQDDYTLFREQAGLASLLYRGQKAYTYNLLYNGTFYWNSPEFQNGTVLYDGKTYADVQLNIDAARQDLLVRLPGSTTDKVLDERFVASFTLGGRQFLNLQYLYGPDAPAGYWEVIHEGSARLLMRVTKTLEQDIDGRKWDQTGYEGTYRPNIYQTFVRSAAYRCVFENGEILTLRRRSDLLKHFEPSFRREIRRHIRHREVAANLSFENFCKEVLNYVESK